MYKGVCVHMYKGVCVCVLGRGGGVALLILSHFSVISYENENEIINYFIFIGYSKMGGREGG